MAKGKVFEVGKKYQTNDLSHDLGGSKVFVKYPNGDILIYKDIKNPWVYRKKILDEDPNLKVWYKKPGEE